MDDQGNPMEPYVFQSWVLRGNSQVSLGKLRFPICIWEVAGPGALWGPQSLSGCLRFCQIPARLHVSLLLSREPAWEALTPLIPL